MEPLTYEKLKEVFDKFPPRQPEQKPISLTRGQFDMFKDVARETQIPRFPYIIFGIPVVIREDREAE